MSQFSPGSSFPRPRFNLGMPTGPTVGLQAAGIEDPVVGHDPAGQQLQGALNEFVQTVGIAASISDRRANEAARAAYRAEMDAKKAEELQWGAVSRAISTTVRERLPGDIDAIGKGTFGWIPSDQSDPEIRMQRLAEEATVDVPEQFRERAVEQFKAQWATRGLNAMYAKSAADQKQAKKTAKDGATDEVMLLTDPSKIATTIDTAKRTIPGFTDDDADEIVVSAMLNTARLGTPDSIKMVEGFKSYLGKREVAARDQADRLVESGKQKDEIERNKQFANEAASIRDRAFNLQTTPEKVKAEIQDAAKRLGIEPRIVEDQIAGTNTAIARQRNEQAKQMEYERVANEITASNFVAVNQVLSSVGDATTPPTGAIAKIDFQPIPGLPPELGGVKAQQEQFISQARFQTGVDLTNLDGRDGVNMNRWTKYVRALAGSGVSDEQIKNTLLSLDFGTTDKNVAVPMNPQNAQAARMAQIIRTVNPNYFNSMVAGDPNAKRFYDSIGVDMLTPGAVLSDQIIRKAEAAGRIKQQDIAQPGDKVYTEVLKAAPNLSPSMVQYAARTYNEQKGKAGAMEYAIGEAQGRGVQLWQSWWLNRANPFADGRNAATRPLVDLGTLADQDPSVRPAIGTAMESLLATRASEINKLDPTLKIKPDDLGLDYVGNGVWEVNGLVAGNLDHKYDHLFFVTDPQVREQIGKNTDTAKVKPLDSLLSDLAEAKRYQAQLDEFVKTDGANGQKPPTTKLLPNGGMSMGGMVSAQGLIADLQTKISIRKLQESQKNP